MALGSGLKAEGAAFFNHAPKQALLALLKSQPEIR
jgi:hypothetical protein